MVPPNGTHEPPYPTGDNDPRPWWHRELQREVEEMKEKGLATEVALIRQELQALKLVYQQDLKDMKNVQKNQTSDIKRLTWAIGLGIPALGAVVAAATRVSGM